MVYMLYAMFSFDEVYYTKTCCRYHGKIVLCIMFNVQLTRIKVMENPINISYGPRPLEPHMDVPEYESHPGLNLLHSNEYVCWCV